RAGRGRRRTGLEPSVGEVNGMRVDHEANKRSAPSGTARRGALIRAAVFGVMLTLAGRAGVNWGEGPARMANGAEGVDRRAAEVRHLNMRYTFRAPATRSEWEARREELRQQILVGAGLWPLPEKKPLNARVFGKIEGDDYTVEKVLLETWPGF